MGIIIKPIITEKMSNLGETLNRYGFKVDKNANKIEIKNAIEKMYSVTVTDVNTMVSAPKKRIRYTKSGFNKGATTAYKKAIVTLKEGDTIDFYSNI
ncbi:MAG: 50S ribosomal protein L23 [Porphyromonadaceae bacterium]|jgi:large subunit ribosomal protein L23|nr:50S ribosomal protein L23 [Porphyromonadaceae bacterium]